MARTVNATKPVTLPWRVIIDTAEQQPFCFDGIHADAAKAGRPIIVETVRRCLGRYPISCGDYSMETADGAHSFVGWVAIERKSLEDCQETLLNFGDGRHERFEEEMRMFQRINASGGAALVIVEGNFDTAIKNAPAFGIRTPQTNAKTIHRSILAMMMDYGVPWFPAGDRRMAEITAFRWMERYWRKHRSRVLGGLGGNEACSH